MRFCVCRCVYVYSNEEFYTMGINSYMFIWIIIVENGKRKKENKRERKKKKGKKKKKKSKLGYRCLQTGKLATIEVEHVSASSN